MAEHFKIVFEGQLRTGVDLETARLNLAQLFKSDVSSMDRLFTGKPVTVKRGLTQDDELLGGQAVEPTGHPGFAAGEGTSDDVEAGIGRHDEHLAAVIRVRGAFGQTELDEAVDGAVHAGGGDALDGGEFGGRLRALRDADEDAELVRRDVGGAFEAHPPRDALAGQTEVVCEGGEIW